MTPEQRQALAMASARKRMAEASAPQEKSWGQTIKENIFGDDDDTTQNFGETVGSLLNKGGESMTLGLVGDEASAAAAHLIPGGQDYGERLAFERGQEALVEENHPALSLGADIGGALMMPVGGAYSAMAKIPSLLGRVGAGGLIGGAMGATSGFTEGEGGFGPRMAKGANDGAFGVGFGGILPVAGYGLKKGADAWANRGAARINEVVRRAPTTAKLKADAGKMFNEMDSAGINVLPKRVGDLADDIQGGIVKGGGFNEAITPNSAAVAREVGKFKDAAVQSGGASFDDIVTQARVAANAASNNPGSNDARLAWSAWGKISGFMKSIDPSDVSSGDVDKIKTILPTANKLWQRMVKSNMVDDIINASDGYLGGTSSGVRNKLAIILRNKKLREQFTEAELKAMGRIVGGTPLEQTVQLAGGGLGRIAMTGAGGATGGIPGALGAAAVGAGTRKVADGIAMKNAQKLRGFLAAGGGDALQALPRLTSNMAPSGPGLLSEMLLKGQSAYPKPQLLPR